MDQVVRMRSILGAFIIFFCTGIDLHSQALPQEIREGLFETYINQTIQATGGDVANLVENQEKQYLAMAHFERGKVHERLFQLTLKSTLRLLNRMSDEMESTDLIAAIQFLELKESMYRQKPTQGSLQVPSDLRNPVTLALINWMDPKNGLKSCSNATPQDVGCDLIRILATGDLSDYTEVHQLLKRVNSDDRETLLRELNQQARPSQKAIAIVKWLQNLQLNMIADFQLSGWLYQDVENRLHTRSYYFSNDWNKFQSPVNDFDGSGIYSFLGNHILLNESCHFSNFDRAFISFIESNIVRGVPIMAAEALSRCLDPSAIEENLRAQVTSFQPRTRAQAQAVSDAYIAMERSDIALETLGSHIQRRDYRSFTRITPLSFATMAYLQYSEGGEENWRETRTMVSQLSEEFSALTAATLILQMATEPPSRISPNIYIE